MDRKIRVDQSHCNYLLDLELRAAGWFVPFKDPGRVSRGVGENQALLLRLFESERLPIPDLVAVRGSEVMLVEIDHRLSAALPSLHAYRAIEPFLCSSIQAALSHSESLETLLLAFCRIGPMLDIKPYIATHLLDVVIGFSDPTAPTITWLGRQA